MRLSYYILLLLFDDGRIIIDHSPFIVTSRSLLLSIHFLFLIHVEHPLQPKSEARFTLLLPSLLDNSLFFCIFVHLSPSELSLFQEILDLESGGYFEAEVIRELIVVLHFYVIVADLADFRLR